MSVSRALAPPWIMIIMMAALTAFIALGLAFDAHTTSAAARAGRPAADAQAGQHSIVETGAHPHADKIQQERGIELVGGNGLVELVECGSPDLIQVRSASKGLFCFKARTWSGTDGFLAVKIADTYLIKGDQHQVKATLTTEEGEKKTYDIVSDQWTSVGEGADPDNGPETLIELRAKA